MHTLLIAAFVANTGALGAPLALHLTDLANTGHMVEYLVKQRCVGVSRLPTMNPRPLTLGRIDIGTFYLGDQRFDYGFDLVLASESAIHGELRGRWRPNANLDEIYFMPRLGLPPAWQQAVDTATYPALIVGGATIATVVLMKILSGTPH
jgi:hypothetical protein